MRCADLPIDRTLNKTHTTLYQSGMGLCIEVCRPFTYMYIHIYNVTSDF